MFEGKVHSSLMLFLTNPNTDLPADPRNPCVLGARAMNFQLGGMIHCHGTVVLVKKTGW